METNRDTILQAAANGNAQALEFLRVFARRAHWIDDLADGDRLDAGARYSVHKLAEMEAEWLLCLSGNPFFLAHRAQLVPAMVLALNAWVDSDARMGRVRDVVKGQWHEVVWLVAWLTGGWEKLRATSSQFRAYDFEEERPAVREESIGGLLKGILTCARCNAPNDRAPKATCSKCGEEWRAAAMAFDAPDGKCPPDHRNGGPG